MATCIIYSLLIYIRLTLNNLLVMVIKITASKRETQIGISRIFTVNRGFKDTWLLIDNFQWKHIYSILDVFVNIQHRTCKNEKIQLV